MEGKMMTDTLKTFEELWQTTLAGKIDRELDAKLLQLAKEIDSADIPLHVVMRNTTTIEHARTLALYAKRAGK